MLSSLRHVSPRGTPFRAFAGFATGIGLALGAVVAVGYVPALPASAAPGSGSAVAMTDPAKIWSEDFEKGGPSATALPSYMSAAGTTYSADPYWLDQGQCNGVILSYNSGPTPDCPDDAEGGAGSRQNLQRLADSLGQYRLGVPGSANPAVPADGSTAGADPATASRANRVLGEITRNSPRPFNQIEFRTAANVPLPASNRFLAMSVDVADVSCFGPGGSKLDFSFLDPAGAVVPTGSPSYSVCDDPGRRFFASPLPAGVSSWVFGGNSVAVGTMKRTKPVLVHGNSVGVLMRNQAPAGSGDDHAFDNLGIYDLTPTLSQTFTPGSVPAGGTAELRMTVTNTSDLEAKPGWSFTNTLPRGLTVTGAAPITNTCANGAGSVTAAGASFTVSGDLLPGQPSCTVTVSVTSVAPATGETSPRTFTSGPANFGTLLGLNAPAIASIQFLGGPTQSRNKTPDAAPQVIVTKSVDPVPGSAVGVGQDLVYSLTFSNIGASVAHVDRVEDLRGVLDDATLTQGPTASDPAWNIGPPHEGMAPVDGALAPSQTVSIHYTAKVKPDGKRGDNVLVSTLLPQGSLPESAPEKTCPPQAEACVENPVSSWSVTLTADKAVAAPGDTVSYTAKQSNTGAVAIQGPLQVTIDLDGALEAAHYDGDAPAAVDYSSPRLSWSTALAAGEQRTITYTLTVKHSPGANPRLRSVVVGGSNCPSGSTASDCNSETIVGAGTLTEPGNGVAVSPDPHSVPVITTTAANTPNPVLFVGGLAALTAGLLGILFRIRHLSGQNPAGRRTGP